MNKNTIFNLICMIIIAIFSFSMNAAAQTQCSVATFGPISLIQAGQNDAIKQIVKICANNFLGEESIEVRFASYSIFNANSPIDMQTIEIEPKKGKCVYPNLTRIRDFGTSQFDHDDLSETLNKRKRSLKNKDVFFRVGYLTDSERPLPLVLSAQTITYGERKGEPFDSFYSHSYTLQFSEPFDPDDPPEPV